MNPPFIIEVPQAFYFEDDHCANCLAELPLDVQGLYCSTWCQEVAAHVRYMRRVFRDGRIEDPDVQLAIQTKNAFLLVGGYRSLGRKLTPRIRTEVRERDGGRCQECGRPGLEVDHIEGNSDELDNLQLLCLDCHHAKTAGNMEPAGPEDREALRGMFETRVVPDEPQLLADDEMGWNGVWRGLQTARKERFLNQLRAAGVPVRRNDSHGTRVLSYLDATESADSATTTPDDFGKDDLLDKVIGRNEGTRSI